MSRVNRRQTAQCFPRNSEVRRDHGFRYPLQQARVLDDKVVVPFRGGAADEAKNSILQIDISSSSFLAEKIFQRREPLAKFFPGVQGDRKDRCVFHAINIQRCFAPVMESLRIGYPTVFHSKLDNVFLPVRVGVR